ncbi:MAG: pilus assembly protein PilM [Phycisphaerales bacterium]
MKDRIRNVSSGLTSSGPSPVAVDFGAAGVKVLQLSGGSTPNLVAAAYLPTPENLLGEPTKRLAWQLEQLPALVRAGGFKGRRSVCAIPTSQSFCKHVQVPAGNPRQVASAVEETIAAQLMCDRSALLCRNVEVGPAPSGGGKVEAIAIAASRAMVDRLMQCLRDCRLEPVGMQPEALAVLRAFDHITRRVDDADTTSLYLDIGSAHTRVMIAHGTQLVFTKPIGVGGFTFDSVVAKQLKVEYAEAHRERLACGALTVSESAPAPAAATAPPPPPATSEADGAKKDEGDGMAVLRAAMSTGPARGGMGGATAAAATAATTATTGAGSAVDDRRGGALPTGHDAVRRGLVNFVGPRIDLRESLDALTDELVMCLRYHDALFPGRKLTRTIFVGGESRHTALCQHVARVLKAPASIADPLARIARTGNEPVEGVKFDRPQPGWAVAVGLCLGPTDL